MSEVRRLFNHARVVWQEGDEDTDIGEAAVTGSVDNGGIIVLQQEGREILINRRSAPAVRRMIRDLEKVQS